MWRHFRFDVPQWRVSKRGMISTAGATEADPREARACLARCRRGTEFVKSRRLTNSGIAGAPKGPSAEKAAVAKEALVVLDIGSNELSNPFNPTSRRNLCHAESICGSCADGSSSIQANRYGSALAPILRIAIAGFSMSAIPGPFIASHSESNLP
jgi:hypothetical protein